MTFFDYAVIVIVALSLLLGVLRGVVSEVLSLAAWVLAIVAAKLLAPKLAPEFAQWIFDPSLQYLAAFAVIVVAVLIFGAVVKLLMKSVIKAIGLGTIDRILGAVFGMTRGAGVVLILVAAGGLTAIPKQSWWRDAALSPPLETAVIGIKPWLPQQWASKVRYR